MTDDWKAGGFGIYIHWPFCASKCPYCDFNSHVSANINQQNWRRAYQEEIASYAAKFPNRTLDSVYFGGGTPSLMDPDLVSDIIVQIKKSWPLRNDLEITLEANPTSVEAAKFAAFKDAGITRVSIGVQALDDASLIALGRRHTTAEAIQAIEIAQQYFNRFNFDLIYARQNQTAEHWINELNQALSIGTDHLSLYQLTIEPNTAFAERHKQGGLLGLPNDDISADLYELTQAICNKAGLPAYEVSNHARDGSHSRHNMVYWRYGDYIGIGPGAHGRLSKSSKRFGTQTTLSPDQWLEDVKEGTATIWTELTREEQASELVLMGLRINSGIELERYNRLLGSPMRPEKLDELQSMGMIKVENGYLRTTPLGRPVLNSLITQLLA